MGSMGGNMGSMGGNMGSIGRNMGSIGGNMRSMGENIGSMGGNMENLGSLGRNLKSLGGNMGSNMGSIGGNIGSVGSMAGNEGSIGGNIGSMGGNNESKGRYNESREGYNNSREGYSGNSSIGRSLGGNRRGSFSGNGNGETKIETIVSIRGEGNGCYPDTEESHTGESGYNGFNTTYSCTSGKRANAHRLPMKEKKQRKSFLPKRVYKNPRVYINPSYQKELEKYLKEGSIIQLKLKPHQNKAKYYCLHCKINFCEYKSHVETAWHSIHVRTCVDFQSCFNSGNGAKLKTNNVPHQRMIAKAMESYAAIKLDLLKLKKHQPKIIKTDPDQIIVNIKKDPDIKEEIKIDKGSEKVIGNIKKETESENSTPGQILNINIGTDCNDILNVKKDPETKVTTTKQIQVSEVYIGKVIKIVDKNYGIGFVKRIGTGEVFQCLFDLCDILVDNRYCHINNSEKILNNSLGNLMEVGDFIKIHGVYIDIKESDNLKRNILVMATSIVYAKTHKKLEQMGTPECFRIKDISCEKLENFDRVRKVLNKVSVSEVENEIINSI